METERIIRDYIGAKKRDWAVFTVSASAVLAGIGYMIRYIAMLTRSTNASPESLPYMASSLVAVFVGAYFIGTYAPKTVGASERTRRSLSRIAEGGGYDRAAMELYEADRGKHLVITEHYIFGEHNGIAAPLSDITDYKSMYNRHAGYYSSAMAVEGILIKLTDGRWYTVSSGKTRFSDYPFFCGLLEEAVKKNTSGGDVR
ncbi:MAG: hypothetical protein IKD81_00735 [Eubacteriaceae bacterium]|nr:hypothetical protein [Eubacteriaceae bacterium]